jgi:hypothetical protein
MTHKYSVEGMPNRVVLVNRFQGTIYSADRIFRPERYRALREAQTDQPLEAKIVDIMPINWQDNRVPGLISKNRRKVA